MGPAILGVQPKALSMVPDDNAAQASAISMIAGLGHWGAVFANVIFGQISDRTTSRWGRRRPWLVIGILSMTVGLSMMGALNTVPLVALGRLSGQIGANAAPAPFVAVLSDQVPEFQRARIASWISIAQNLAVLVAAFLADAMRNQRMVLFVVPAIPVIPAILFMVCFTFVLPDKPLPVRPAPFRLIDMARTFWGSPTARPDYAPAGWGRFLITFASFSFTTHRLMCLMHRVDLTQDEATRTVTVSAFIYTIVLMGASFVGGILSDMLHRRKVFVLLASVLFGIGTVMPAHTTTCTDALRRRGRHGSGLRRLHRGGPRPRGRRPAQPGQRRKGPGGVQHRQRPAPDAGPPASLPCSWGSGRRTGPATRPCATWPEPAPSSAASSSSRSVRSGEPRSCPRARTGLDQGRPGPGPSGARSLPSVPGRAALGLSSAARRSSSRRSRATTTGRAAPTAATRMPLRLSLGPRAPGPAPSA